MTLKDKIEILDRKIKAEQAKYGLDKAAAEISAKSSGDVEAYEVLTGKELIGPPSVVEQRKFEIAPLGKVLEKQTKTIKKRGKAQEEAIKDQGEFQAAIMK